MTIIRIVILFIVGVCGCFKIDFNNWSLVAENVPANAGKGGFFPFGFAGVIKGAANCFYPFIGFHVIRTAWKNTKDPTKSIPVSICVTQLVIFLANLILSMILTLMIPYHAQVRNS